MRIAHVVTLVSADGSFGGPLSVATGQATELARRGHEVALYAGWDGRGRLDLPPQVDVRLHRARGVVPRSGFSGLLAPGLAVDLARRVRGYDLIHVHLGRDLITTSSALVPLLGHVPYVVQTHGMVGIDDRVRARVVDVLATRRLLRGAAAVLALTEEEEAALVGVAGPLDLTRLANGIATIGSPAGRVPELSTQPPEVLFCARLHPRKRVLAFAEMAAELLSRGVDARFTITGPDEGDLPALSSFIERRGIAHHVRYEGAVKPSEVSARLAKAAVFVLPSVDEPFPMTVLEALACGTPTVVTDSCHIATELELRGAVGVSGPTPEQLADTVMGLLASPERRASLRSAGLTAVRDAFSISAVVDQLESAYTAAIESGTSPAGQQCNKQPPG